jgi:hypothetical protein
VVLPSYAVEDEDPRSLPHRRKRRRRRWCKGVEGVEHTPVIRLIPYIESARRYPVQGRSGDVSMARHHATCRWANWKVRRRGGVDDWWVYVCGHRRVCATCGRVLNHSIPKQECPHYTAREDAAA